MPKKLKQTHPSEEVRCGLWIRGRWVPCDFYGHEGTCSLGHQTGNCPERARAERLREEIEKIMPRNKA